MRGITLPLALALSTALTAQTSTINGGMQIGLSLPTGDFADQKDRFGYFDGANKGVGMHLGGHLDFNLSQHNQLRLVLNAYGFASQKQDTYYAGYFDGTQQNAFGISQFGADYVFNGTSPSRGGYFLVGVNLNNVKATYKLTGSPDLESSQNGRIGIRLGGGYNFSRLFSLEAHVNSVSVEKTGNDGMFMDSLTWVTVSAGFRFGR